MPATVLTPNSEEMLENTHTGIEIKNVQDAKLQSTKQPDKIPCSCLWTEALQDACNIHNQITRISAGAVRRNMRVRIYGLPDLWFACDCFSRKQRKHKDDKNNEDNSDSNK